MPERPLALVGGASSGIGAALAVELARRGHDVLLLARRAERLAAVSEDCRAGRDASAHVLALDLAAPDAVDRVRDELARLGRQPDVLVNNAGFGVHGRFAETPLARELELIDVQLGAMAGLTKLVLPGMIARGRGRILNVSSVYSFSPVAHQAVYAACKAFMLSFTESLACELHGTGVTVTVACPGVTRTEFRKQAGVADKDSFWAMDAADVASAACRALFSGKRIVVPGAMNRIYVLASRWVPRRLMAAVTRRINSWRGLKGEGSR